MKTLDELLKNAGVKRPLEPAERGLGEHVLRGDREFPGGWWHAGDVESGVETIALAQQEHFGTQLISGGLVRETISALLPNEDDEGMAGGGDEEEDRLWEKQVDAVAVHLNAALAARGDSLRLWSFAAIAEPILDDLPIYWLFLTPEERDRLMDLRVVVPVGAGR